MRKAEQGKCNNNIKTGIQGGKKSNFTVEKLDTTLAR